MRSALCILFILVLCQSTFASLEELSDTQFDSTTREGNTLVIFYVPWNLDCNLVEKELDQASSQWYGRIAKIDISKYPRLGIKESINEYPTIRLYKDGSTSDYVGAYTGSNILSWARETGSEYRREYRTSSYSGREHTDSYDYKTSSYSDYRSYEDNGVEESKSVNSRDQASNYQVNYGSDSGDRKYYSQYTSESREEDKYEPSLNSRIIPFEGDTAIQEVLGKEHPALILFSDETRSPQYEEFERASKSISNMIFSHSTVSTGMGKRLAAHLGLKIEDTPSVLIVYAKDDDVHKYKMDGSITSSNIDDFVYNFGKGILKKFLRSQDIPLINEGEVKVVVGKNFKEVVLDSPKHTLLLFYAPWCDHCSKMAAEYEAAAMVLNQNSKYQVLKIDGTENDVADFDIKSYPTILLFADGRKDQPISFDGERVREEIVNFVRENTMEDRIRV